MGGVRKCGNREKRKPVNSRKQELVELIHRSLHQMQALMVLETQDCSSQLKRHGSGKWVQQVSLVLPQALMQPGQRMSGKTVMS
jgi:hypothetical protein